MADLVEARRGARAVLRETVGDHKRVVQGFVGQVYLRDLLDGTAGTALSAHTPDSGGTWSQVDTAGTAMTLNGAGHLIVPTSAGGRRSYRIDAGVSAGCYSFQYRANAASLTNNAPFYFGVRCSSTATLGSNGGYTDGYTIAASTQTGGAFDWRFRRANTTTPIANGTAAGTLSGYYAFEVITTGATVRIWLNGSLIVNYTDPSPHPESQTYVMVGTSDLLGSEATVSEVYVTSVPSCPGAVDLDQESTRWTLAPLAGGAQFTGAAGLHLRWGAVGAPTTDTPDGYAMVLRDTGATTIRNDGYVNVTAAAFGYVQFTDFYARSDGKTTGSDRCGMFEILVGLRATGGLNDWEVNSSSGGGVLLPAGTAHDYGEGYAVASTTMASVTKPSTLQAYSDTIPVTAVMGHVPWASGAWVKGDYIQNGTVRDTETPTTATATSSYTDTADNAYDALLDGVGLRFTGASAGAAWGNDPLVTFTAAPANHRVTGTNSEIVETSSSGSAFTEDAFNVDPRLTIDHHLQLNTNAEFGTDRTSRLTSDLGFYTARILNANSAGIDGIACTETLRDEGNLTALQTRTPAPTSATTSGQAGWLRDGTNGTFKAWDSALPGGNWTHTVAITGPSTATGLAVGGTATWVLLAASPSLRVLIGAGPPTPDRAGHFSGENGDVLQVITGAVDVDTRVVLSTTTTPTATAASVALFRVNALGQAQYLNAAGVWTNVVAGTAIDFHAAAETAAGSGVWLKQFTADTTWGTFDLGIITRVTVGGTPYGGVYKQEVVGSANDHAGYALDAVGLALSGVLSLR